MLATYSGNRVEHFASKTSVPILGRDVNLVEEHWSSFPRAIGVIINCMSYNFSIGLRDNGSEQWWVRIKSVPLQFCKKKIAHRYLIDYNFLHRFLYGEVLWSILASSLRKLCEKLWSMKKPCAILQLSFNIRKRLHHIKLMWTGQIYRKIYFRKSLINISIIHRFEITFYTFFPLPMTNLHIISHLEKKSYKIIFFFIVKMP